MIITFFSNYLTHHQIPFCNELYVMDDVKFTFVSTQPMEAERKQGGWKLDKEYEYELRAYESPYNMMLAKELAAESDVVIIGSAPEFYVKHRMKNGNKKLTFRYSERIYKRGRWRVFSPRGIIKRFNTYFRYFNQPLYMLCASSYAATDFALLGSYIGRCYKWGYFPEKKVYVDFEKKKRNRIIWAGRLLPWKHPEKAIQLARELQIKNIDFEMKIIGSGEMKEQLCSLIEKYQLQQNVSIIEGLTSKQVRKEMEDAGIFLATSDYQEGWGAVVNEAMNSGCAVVASNAMGSVNYLIKNGVNGFSFSYKNKLEADLIEHACKLLQDSEQQKQIGWNAYKTIEKTWNNAIAAERFIDICQCLSKGRKKYYEDGPCSKA